MSKRKEIEQLIFEHANRERKQSLLFPLQFNAILHNLARNHCRRMSRKEQIMHSKKLKVFIKNPIEATLARILIILGFVIAWVLLGIGLLLKKFGRRGYIGKVKENVGVVKLNGLKKHHYKKIARKLYEELTFKKTYLQHLLDPELVLIGIGVKKRKNKYYATMIFYG